MLARSVGFRKPRVKSGEQSLPVKTALQQARARLHRWRAELLATAGVAACRLRARYVLLQREVAAWRQRKPSSTDKSHVERAYVDFEYGERPVGIALVRLQSDIGGSLAPAVDTEDDATDLPLSETIMIHGRLYRITSEWV